jgi:peptidoglycan/xylan/chitin deacetylase (PgdA/CDA1 family)
MPTTNGSQANAGQSRTLRSRLRWIYICALHCTGLLALAKRWVHSQGAIVLTFHRILSDHAAAQTYSPAGLVMRERTFESLLKFVSDSYQIFDVHTGFSAGKAARTPVAITFDDGWEDNASTAFPIASALKIPFTIFVCPELMDMAEPFWPEKVVGLFRSAGNSTDSIRQISRSLMSCGYPEWAYAVASTNGSRCDILIERLKSLSSEERRRVLQSLLSGRIPQGQSGNGTVDRTVSWSQARQLRNAGINFGSHTQHHEILPAVQRERAEQEVKDSRAAIEEHLGTCSTFSYPNGDFSKEVQEIVASCGYKRAFINCPGVWREQDDPFLIPRINLSEGTVTGPNGHFSPRAFEYRVFWNAFVNGKRRVRPAFQSETIPNSSTVEKFNTL